MSKPWNRLLAWLRDMRPVTARAANRRELALMDDLRVVEEKLQFDLRQKEKQRLDDLAALKNRHAIELEKRSEKVASLLDKIATTHWQYGTHGSYCVQVSMNPDVLGGVSMYRDDLRFLAEMIGRQVEREIASGHFVKAAYQTERDLQPRMWRVPQ